MLDIIRETAAFICSETTPDRIVSSAEALYGMTSGSLSPDDGMRVLSALIGKDLAIKENIPNRATALIVSATAEFHKNALKCDISAVKELAEVLGALPKKHFFSDKASITEFNLNISGYNSKHHAKLPFIV